jgi:large subunit ribosomal protein L5
MAVSRMHARYQQEVRPWMRKELAYTNDIAVPQLKKVVVNMGLGEAKDNIKILDAALAELGQITGQKAIITRARKSVANFKLRKKMPIGAAVTLRGEYMYEFLDRLINLALPRVRDFRGLSSKSFDGRGNYTLGLRDQLVFPEVDYSRVDRVRGMNITVVTTAKTDEEARTLLKQLGLPLRD